MRLRGARVPRQRRASRRPDFLLAGHRAGSLVPPGAASHNHLYSASQRGAVRTRLSAPARGDTSDRWACGTSACEPGREARAGAVPTTADPGASRRDGPGAAAGAAGRGGARRARRLPGGGPDRGGRRGVGPADVPAGRRGAVHGRRRGGLGRRRRWRRQRRLQRLACTRRRPDRLRRGPDRALRRGRAQDRHGQAGRGRLRAHRSLAVRQLVAARRLVPGRVRPGRRGEG